MLFDIFRAAIACVIAGGAGYARLQDPVPATTQEMAAWIGLTFIGTMVLLGALRSAWNNRASL